MQYGSAENVRSMFGRSSGALARYAASEPFGPVVVTGVGGSRSLAILCADVLRDRVGCFATFWPMVNLLVGSTQPAKLIVVSASGDHLSLGRIIEDRKRSGKSTLLVTLEPECESALALSGEREGVVAPPRSLRIDEFISTHNARWLVSLMLCSLEEGQARVLLDAFVGGLERGANAPEVWQDLRGGCTIGFSAELAATAADVETRLKELGTQSVAAFDQLDLVHGGYVQVDAILQKQDKPLLLITSQGDRQIFDHVDSSLKLSARILRVEFEGSPALAASCALGWSIGSFLKCQEQTNELFGPTLPKWGRDLWERWR
jgi:hypothetical protein